MGASLRRLYLNSIHVQLLTLLFLRQDFPRFPIRRVVPEDEAAVAALAAVAFDAEARGFVVEAFFLSGTEKVLLRNEEHQCVAKASHKRYLKRGLM